MGDPSLPDITIQRFDGNPIIRPDMNGRIGTNINGPSLIRVPQWIKNALGRYYLYFSAHKGRYIRLAYADDLRGPWKIYEPGSLPLEDSYFLLKPAPPPKDVSKEALQESYGEHVPTKWEDMTLPHIASPDVHVLEDQKEIRLYYHGLERFGGQFSRVAVSKDGIHFTAYKKIVVNRSYLRVFSYKGHYCGMAMPGVFYRSQSGLTDFEEGPTLFNPDMRHAGLLVMGDRLMVFWTQVGHRPERILLSTVDLHGDWSEWKASAPAEILRPEYAWEGADLPAEPSVRSAVNSPVNQLRDPAIFQEDGHTYLLYAVAGESGIAIAEMHFAV